MQWSRKYTWENKTWVCCGQLHFMAVHNFPPLAWPCFVGEPGNKPYLQQVMLHHPSCPWLQLSKTTWGCSLVLILSCPKALLAQTSTLRKRLFGEVVRQADNSLAFLSVQAVNGNLISFANEVKPLIPPHFVWHGCTGLDMLFTVCKTGGRRPGPFYHMNDISVYQGRQREERGSQSHFVHTFVLLFPSIFSYSKRSKLGQWKALETRLGGFNN